MRRLVWAWVAGTVTYVAVLMGGAVLVGVVATRSGQVVAPWSLLVVPGVVAAALAVLVATARSVVRPPRRRGLVAVAVPAAVAFGLSVVAALEAVSRADVHPLVVAVDVAVPALTVLATGTVGGVLSHVRWTPAARSSYMEVV